MHVDELEYFLQPHVSLDAPCDADAAIPGGVTQHQQRTLHQRFRDILRSTFG
jgi:hypothetical protein